MGTGSLPGVAFVAYGKGETYLSDKIEVTLTKIKMDM
jgi:hypothetical protein